MKSTLFKQSKQKKKCTFRPYRILMKHFTSRKELITWRKCYVRKASEWIKGRLHLLISDHVVISHTKYNICNNMGVTRVKW